MGRRYDNILQTIGNTPVVKLNRLAPAGVDVYVKVESFNPMGSVKDRLALGVIEDAELRGELKPGQTVVEATSGNTGIGLAMVCAQKGYPLVVTMAENFSVERRRLMRFLGARVVLTPASEKGSGMVNKARELAAAHGWWQPRQFDNPANADFHARTTAVEILDDFADTTLDYFVTGFGTGGTVSGVARTLKARSPATKILVCEPDNSPMMGSGIAQPRHADGSEAGSHPGFRPHLMQGWSPDFISTLAEEALASGNIDGFLPIEGNSALDYSRRLAREEGIFVGISAGATLAGALQLAATLPAGSKVLCMLPDTGERYLSTPLFEDIPAEMTEEEISLSFSTPGYRFDSQSAARQTDDSPADEESVAELEQLISASPDKVVMFALEWCEFCWSVRKVLKASEVKYTSVDLDSTLYQENDRGGRLRKALRQKTGWNTFPQIFIDGEFLGGCTDLFDGIKTDELRITLEKSDIHSKPLGKDPYEYLPGWLHPR